MCLSDSTTSKFRRLRLSSQCYASLSQMRDLINRCLSSGFFLSMSSTLNALKCRIHKKMFCPIKWPQNMNTAVHDLSLPEWLSKPAGKTPMCLVCVKIGWIPYYVLSPGFLLQTRHSIFTISKNNCRIATTHVLRDSVSKYDGLWSCSISRYLS